MRKHAGSSPVIRTKNIVEVYMQNEVLEFINRRWKKDADWCNGNCYWFAKILCERFSYLSIYYEPIVGHFVACSDTKQYDWLGEYEIDKSLISLDDIKRLDPTWYNRLIRDCVL